MVQGVAQIPWQVGLSPTRAQRLQKPNPLAHGVLPFQDQIIQATLTTNTGDFLHGIPVDSSSKSVCYAIYKLSIY
jgi:hypothetical protein